MPVARKTVVDVGQVGVYHCISRWVRNVESYGGLFYRIVGPLESIAARAREKGLPWLRGLKGSRELYRAIEKAA